jgi:hypothetical protein
VYVAQLSNSLPPMVVEILEEKFNREYCDDVSRILADEQMKCSAENGEGCSRTAADVEEGLLEIPKNWEPMDPSLVCNLSVIRFFDQHLLEEHVNCGAALLLLK